MVSKVEEHSIVVVAVIAAIAFGVTGVAMLTALPWQSWVITALVMFIATLVAGWPGIAAGFNVPALWYALTVGVDGMPVLIWVMTGLVIYAMVATDLHHT